MSPETLAAALEPIWKDGVAAAGYEPALWLEPGRFLVAASGFLVRQGSRLQAEVRRSGLGPCLWARTQFSLRFGGAKH